MSRYAWPGSKKKGHSGVARVEWDMRTSGLMTERAVSSARDAQALAGSALRAPGNDAGLWIPIGPAGVLNGGIVGNPRVTGRVRDISVSRDGTRVYAATAGGGVWYSNDSGTSWSPIGNWSATPTISSFVRSANALSCGCLLVTFGTAADGSGDDVYVGTGEIRRSTTGQHFDKVAGVGVLHLVSRLADALADPFLDVWKREAPNLAGHAIYRLARDPNDPNRLVAATDIGLFTRAQGFQVDRNWTRVKKGPLDFDADDDKWTTDVLWTAAGRLFVGVIDDTRFSDTGVYLSTHGVDGPFDKVDLEGIDDPRKIRIGLAVAPNDAGRVYVLTSGPKLWRIDGTNGRRVGRVPKLLFGTNDQSEYDLAITVDPKDSNRIVLGGSAFDLPGNGTSGLLFSCSVQTHDGNLVLDFEERNQKGPTQDPTYIGLGVHDDVHQAVFADVAPAQPPHLWIASDGGVFRSTNTDRHLTFAACNTGLAALQCGFVANHPTTDGFVFTGTHDNGILMRIGDTIWEGSDFFRGDGGCVLVHPVHSNRVIAHEHNARWHSNSDSFTPPVFRTPDETRAQLKESNASAFYSAGDIREIDGKAAVALGTNRVWLAENWDPTNRRRTSWATLPSGIDPLDFDPDDVGTDTFHGSDGKVIACRWASDTRLVVLCRRAVLVFNRDADGDWERKVISNHDPKCGDLDNGDIPVGTSEWMPPRGEWTDLAIYDNLGTNGRFYVATTGFVKMDDDTPKEFDRLDTLWWYDGSGRFHPTGLRNHNTPPDDVGTEAPALAVVVDPDDKNAVYVGTSIGVWRGVLTFSGNTPGWKWSIFSNGLPETTVYDLSFFNHLGLKLLRAALGSRGVWEVDLSPTPRPVAQTFVRVHPFDTRRREVTSLNNPVGVEDDDLRFLWYVSPDIRIRPAAGGAVPPVPDGGSINWTSSPGDAYTHELWTFQTAFRVREPLCRPDGVWSEQFQALLDMHFGDHRINSARWTSVVTAADVFQRPWGAGEPTEMDLYELIVEQASLGWAIPRRPLLDRRAYNVEVLVHHRHPRAVRRDQVRVALLRRALPDDRDAWGRVAVSATWKTRVAQLVSGNPLPPGFSLPDGWVAAGTPRVASPRLDVDASHPRVVTFDVTFSGLTGPRRPHVLLAVVASDVDPVSSQTLAGDTLEDLVVFSHHAAARVVQV